MRKIVAIFFAGLLGTVCMAAPVGKDQARVLAGKVLGIRPENARLQLGSEATMRLGSMEEPAYYIYNNPAGGFVIIAGDDALAPVLAYSHTGSFKTAGMPANLRNYLAGVSRMVRFARDKRLAPGAKIRRDWQELSMKPAATTGVLLETACWDQSSPYNLYCPTVANETERSATGCVATALGIMMRYYEWPPCGKGTLPSYTYQYSSKQNVTVSGRTLGYAYDYSLMPLEDIDDEYGTLTATQAQKEQVARLLADLGIMVEMEYSAEGSAAYTDKVATRMKQYFYYKSGAEDVFRDDYTTAQWVSLLKGQLDAGHPLVYGAACADTDGDGYYDGGHEFLVTGYDTEDNFYVNWGFGGFANGFFAIDYFYPYADYEIPDEYKDEINEDTWGFFYLHDTIINLEPDRSVTPVPSEPEETPDGLYLQAGTHTSGNTTYSYPGIKLSSGQVAENADFQLDAGLIYNYGSTSYSGYFHFYQVDWSGQILRALDSNTFKRTIKSGNYSYIYNIPCKTTSIKLGDKIVLCYQDGSSYTQIDWNKSDTVGEYPMVPLYFIDPVGRKSVVNSLESYTSADWSTDGNAVKVVLTYADGSVETIVQE
ncbi:MAG: C10 family peptidase [Bacteroidales bacterium]|nr:C10 family peptidase [Bacteroidales bacterium]